MPKKKITKDSTVDSILSKKKLSKKDISKLGKLSSGINEHFNRFVETPKQLGISNEEYQRKLAGLDAVLESRLEKQQLLLKKLSTENLVENYKE